MASVGVDEDEDLTSTITVARNAVALDRTVDLNDEFEEGGGSGDAGSGEEGADSDEEDGRR